jgi:hypothetical protein
MFFMNFMVNIFIQLKMAEDGIDLKNYKISKLHTITHSNPGTLGPLNPKCIETGIGFKLPLVTKGNTVCPDEP